MKRIRKQKELKPSELQSPSRTEIKTADELHEFAENIINTVREPLIVLDENLRVIKASRSFYDCFKVTPEETIGKLIYDLGNRQWDIPKLHELLETILPEKTVFDDYNVEHDFATIGKRTMLLNARQIKRPPGKEHMILLAIADITERRIKETCVEKKRKELAVIQSAADEVSDFAENLINTLHDPFIALDQDLRVIKANRAFYDFFNVTAAETIGQLIYDLGNKQWDIPKLRELLETILPDKTTFDNYEVDHTFATIGKRVMLLNARQVQRALGKPKIILLAMEDITENQRIKEILTASENRYRRLFETAKDGILILDAETGMIVEVNPFLIELLGYSHEMFLGKAIWEIGFFKNIIANKEKFLELQQNEYTRYDDLPLETSDGRKIDVEFVSNVYLVDNKKVIQCNIRDISKRKLVEEALKHSKRDMEILLENINDAVFSVDVVNNKMLTVSAAHSTIFGYPPSAFIKNPQLVFDLIIPEDRAMIEEGMQILNEGKRMQQEIRIVRADGELRWIESKIKPTLDSTGKLIRIDGVISDITDRKQSEKELEVSRHVFETLTQVSPVGIFRTNLDGGTTYVNPRWSELSGMSSDQAMGFGWIKAIHPEDREWLYQKWQTDIRNLKSSIAEYRFLQSDGSVVWVLGNAVPEMVDNTMLGYIGTATDITQQKKAEKALIKSEQRYLDMFNNAPVGYHELDSEGKIVQVNQTELDLLGYSREEMVGSFIWDFVDDKNLAQQRVIEKLKSYALPAAGVERKYRKKDNTYMILLIEDKLIKDETGMITGLRSTLQDITARKHDENELIKLSMAVEQSPASIVITDTCGTIEYVNKALTHITGYTPEEVIGKNPRILQSGHTTLKEYKQLWKTILGGGTWTGEFLNVKKNKELYWEEAAISAIKDKDGVITHFLAIKRDITEYKRITEELYIAKETAEEMSRLKSNFLANMSHELRTPMIGILGYSEILRDDTKDEELKEVGNIIHASGQRLMETLNLILDLSRIEAQKLEIKLSSINIVHIIESVATLFKIAAAKKHITLTLDSPFDSLNLLLDGKLFREIINNLVNNAIKFTKYGGVTIQVRKEKTNKTEWAVIKVVDTGIGIAKGNIDLIFDEFRQASEGKSRSFEGTGLGLTITKKFVEKLKGTISVESTLDVGSVFTIKFKMPAENIEQPTMNEVIPARLVERLVDEGAILPEVLYVEDDPIAVRVVKRLLEQVCTIESTERPEIALEMVHKKQYKAVLMDINLGRGMDGMATAKMIKELPGYEHVPIVAVTAFAMVGDKEEFLSGGCTHYISKPFSKKELQSLMMEVLHPEVK